MVARPRPLPRLLDDLEFEVERVVGEAAEVQRGLEAACHAIQGEPDDADARRVARAASQ